jgi:PAS fold.
MASLGNIVTVAQQMRERLGNGAPEILERRAAEHLKDDDGDAARYWVRVAKAIRYLNSFDKNYLPRGGRSRAIQMPADALAEVFRSLPQPTLLLQPNLVIVGANAAYLEITGTTEAELLGAELFSVFPDNPSGPVNGTAILGASFARVLDGGMPDRVEMMRYDVRDSDGSFRERWWSPVNTPVLDEKGRIRLIMHQAFEVRPALVPSNDA